MSGFVLTSELQTLVAALADWSAPPVSVTVYLFGSRVRGDHRPDSDVDVDVDWGDRPDDTTTDWCTNVQETDFSELRAKLALAVDARAMWTPKLRKAIREAEVVYRERNVICICLPGKPA